MSAPAPATVNVLPSHDALPGAPTAPISAVLHPLGSGCAEQQSEFESEEYPDIHEAASQPVPLQVARTLPPESYGSTTG
jgi:hypothetical protein